MNDVYIGLGANIGDRKKYLDEAIGMLQEDYNITLYECSSIYETVPVGYDNQGHFLNMVIHVKTILSKWEVLLACQSIEKQLGRERLIENGPRTIDLDILLYNNEVNRSDDLIIPHPRLHERAFVLVPLNDIAAHVLVPKVGCSVNDLLARLPKEDLNEVVKWKRL